jgi:hypothetical protein
MPMLASTAPRRLEVGLSSAPSCCHCRRRVLTPMVFLIVVMLMTGCGTGAFHGPSAGHRHPATASPKASAAGRASMRSPSNPTVSPTRSSPVRRMAYSYSLPYGDTGYAQDDEIVYGMLLHGQCAAAQKKLDQSWFRLGIGGPREVVMMQVAIEMCGKNDSAAHHFFDIAKMRYGWSGLSLDVWSCNIYRATESFWLQIPQNSTKLMCPGGEIPLWPGNRPFPSQLGRACEDPRFGPGRCVGPAPSVRPTTPIPSPSSAPTESGSPTSAANTPISSRSASTTS